MTSEALLLSLKAWPEQDPSSKALSSLIPLIQRQRGAFRNVNEAVLEEEIAAAAAAEAASAAATSQDDVADASLSKTEDGSSGAEQQNQQQQQQQNPKEAILAKRQELIHLVG